MANEEKKVLDDDQLDVANGGRMFKTPIVNDDTI